MRINDLRAELRAQPFRPFTVHLADGRSFEVGHPELIAVSPAGRSCTIYDDKGHRQVIDPMLVTGICGQDGEPQAE